MKRALLLLCIACLLLLPVGCRPAVETNDPSVLHLRYAEYYSEAYPTTQGSLYFAKLVEERTDGRIRIHVHPERALGDEPSALEQLSFGGIDFATISIQQLSNRYPKFATLALPYIYRDKEHLFKVLDGEIGASLLQNLSDADLVGLCWYDAGALNYYNDKWEITLPQHMVKQELAVYNNAVSLDTLDILGGTALPYSDYNVYPSLAQGNIDGAEGSLLLYVREEHYRKAKYLFLDEHIQMPSLQIMSGSTFEALSEEDRQIILTCAREAAEHERRLWAEAEEEAMQTLAEANVLITIPTAEQKQQLKNNVIPLYAKYTMSHRDIFDRIVALEQNSDRYPTE